MLKQTSWLFAALAGVAACIDFDSGDPIAPGSRWHVPAGMADHAFARQAIWNWWPGDLPTLAPAQPQPVGPGVGPGVPPSSTTRTLVLYDRGGNWGALGELYAIGATNLASHFGAWAAKPATTYSCGELAAYDATIYVGSTFDEPLPPCLLDDVLAGSRPVIWTSYNLWQLTNRAPTFAATYGFMWTAFDTSAIGQVEYKGRILDRYAANGGGLLGTTIVDPTKVTVLAAARRADGTTLPWALRSGNLTYVAELPFTYMTEEDRYLIFADLLFDALAPNTPERHRIVLRLEDISPMHDPAELRAVADYLSGERIPFGFGVVAEYRDPLGYYSSGASETLPLEESPAVISAIQYMLARGGTMVMHGWTHQYESVLNPYTAVTGDDTEFYRVIENADHTLTYMGPLPDDSVGRTKDRIDAARESFKRAALPQPTIFEFPHYAASVNAYQGAAASFATRWERSLYFPGVLSGATPSYSSMFGQLFPYVVRDVYGTLVLPENLGNIEPEPFHIFPARFPEDIIDAAARNLVVRDGVAGFYFHPFFDLDDLKETVEGVRALGYTFVSPNEL